MKSVSLGSERAKTGIGVGRLSGAVGKASAQFKVDDTIAIQIQFLHKNRPDIGRRSGKGLPCEQDDESDKAPNSARVGGSHRLDDGGVSELLIECHIHDLFGSLARSRGRFSMPFLIAVLQLLRDRASHATWHALRQPRPSFVHERFLIVDENWVRPHGSSTHATLISWTNHGAAGVLCSVNFLRGR